MVAIRSLIFNILYVAWSSLLHIAAVAPVLAGSFAGLRRCAQIWVKGTLVLLRWICGLRYREIGLEYLPKEPAIYAIKHQSAWETLFFTAKLGLPAFVLKRELLSIPVFGWFLRVAGMVAIDRSKGTHAMKQLMRDLKSDRLRDREVVIFPEGTRVAPGGRRKYHAGVAAIYGQLDRPVVPVALNSGLFWGRRAFLKRPGTIVVQYLPAIAPGLDRKAFMDELERRIETASTALLKDPQTAPC